MEGDKNREYLVLDAMRLAERSYLASDIDFGLTRNIVLITTPATPLHGSAPGGLLFCGAGK